MKRFLTFLESSFLTVQALLGVSAVIVTEVLNQHQLQQTFIVALLTMIIIDFYLLFTRHLKEITHNTQDINKNLAYHGIGIEFVERNAFEWKTIIRSAHHDVFVSGTTLTQYVGGKDIFANLSKHVNVKFLVLDVANKEILEGFRRMRYADNSRHSNQRYLNQANLFKDLYKALRDKPNIDFGVSDRITPITFIGVDVYKLSESSLIRVQHYLYESEADQATVSYVIRPSCPLYSLYAEQIKILWEASIKENTYLDKPDVAISQ